MKSIIRWSGVLSVVLAISASHVLQAANVPVSIVGFTFSPATVTIQVGDTVTWTQKDTTPHTSTSDTGLWDSPFLNLNQTFAHKFDAAGTFPYHCIPHPGMRGSVIVKAAPANQSPVVTITSPSNGATLIDRNVTLEASASDPDGSIAKVQFFEGRTSLGEATSSPFRITVSLAEGPHNISAQATDNTGAITSSAVVTITVTLPPPVNLPPTVALTSPAEGATFTSPASVNLQATANDPDGSIAKVEFFDGQTSLAVVSSSPFQATANLGEGSHTLTAQATDNQGASTVSSAVHIQVMAPAGDIMLSDPAKSADGSKFQFILHGVSGRTYLVQSSPDLRSWTLVKTVVASSDRFAVTDLPLGDLGRSYYRVQAQP